MQISIKAYKIHNLKSGLAQTYGAPRRAVGEVLQVSHRAPTRMLLCPLGGYATLLYLTVSVHELMKRT